ncbi:MAG: 2-C-methyl-D-erythritol 4-phosphate cytidylyltransferase [Pseudomonadota bacterium]
MSTEATNPRGVRLWGVVPAAGRGSRMGAALPKQYLSLAGRTVAEHTLTRLLAFARLARVVVAVAPDDEYFARLPLANDPRLRTCHGGAERCDSVLNALDVLAGEARADDFVLVHDVARPCVRLSDIARLVDAALADPVGAILAQPATDTVKQAGADGRIAATPDRSRIWLAATPQMIRYGLLREALQAARRDGVTVTDEAQAVERRGHLPQLVECARDNLKITRPEDLALAAFWLGRQQEAALDARREDMT